MKRTEWFGMPVSLSEEEKKQFSSREFGKASAADGLDSSKQLEGLKRKATIVADFVDSANKHGILLEVVQIITDLNLLWLPKLIYALMEDGSWMLTNMEFFTVHKLAQKKEVDPDRKLSFAEVFAKTRKHKSNPDVMQFRIDTIKCYNIGKNCATISSDTGGDGTPAIEGPSS
ncbi:ACT domain [Orobanche hederae]